MKRFFVLIVCVLSMFVTALASENPSGTEQETGVFSSIDELDGKRIGIQTGTGYEVVVSRELPHAKVMYFQTKSDLITALRGNKIDAFIIDESVFRYMEIEESPFYMIPEYFSEYSFGFVFPKNSKGDALRKQFNEFVNTIKQQGTLKEMQDLWFEHDEKIKKMPDIENFPAENGVLELATESNYEPFEYVRDGEVVGYDMDIAARFCEAYGYGLKIVDMTFDGILPALSSGKCDFSGAGFNILAERAENVYFSDPYYDSGTVAVVLKKSDSAAGTGTSSGLIGGQSSSFSSLQSSFEKTFLREKRWMLFLRGSLNSLIITIFSVLAGTLLGFILYMLCRDGNPVANFLTDVSVWLVQGMPGVVLLMIIYYVIFGQVSISGILVSIIGFTLTFAAAVIGMLKIGVGAVEKGQYEAAYALGYSDLRTFFTIILPQALPHVTPAFKGEVINLIKATAIVGYIAVQDLTKIGDIVRSRTYEAFFPLISVAVIYFILEGILGFIFTCIERSLDPRRRSREKILKGVKTDD